MLACRLEKCENIKASTETSQTIFSLHYTVYFSNLTFEQPNASLLIELQNIEKNILMSNYY